ncbi:MAG: alpha/beta hydrolase [Propionibacteriales bacterium]|nr:alpha/beta hydrolase [Propionibacteriales bacterium]
MSLGRTASIVPVLARYLLRVLVRLSPQRWLTPAVTLRVLRAANRDGMAVGADRMRQHLPPRTWTTRTDLTYGDNGRDSLFDLVLPDGPGPHPWLLWVHGGGWHFGSKEFPLPYVELLASRGFAGVVVNYPLAPGPAYPAAPRAVNDALAHVLSRASELGLDPDRVVLAGDSAGAQVAAEVATLVTSPEYAARTTVTPALTADQLRGVLLFCGLYDTTALGDSDRHFAAALESAMWSLAGTRHWRSTATSHLMSTRDHVTAAFPPTFLSAGNADPLTATQSVPFAVRLAELGVQVEEFFPGTATAPAHHEFQFALETPAGAEALERVTDFLARTTRG